MSFVTYAKPLLDESFQKFYNLLKTYLLLARAQPEQLGDEEVIVEAIGIFTQDIVVKTKTIIEKLARGLGIVSKRFDDTVFELLRFIDNELPGSFDDKFKFLNRNFFVLTEMVWSLRNFSIHDSHKFLKTTEIQVDKEKWKSDRNQYGYEKRIILIRLELGKKLKDCFSRIPRKFRQFLDYYNGTFFKHVGTEPLETGPLYVTKEYYDDRFDEESRTVISDLHRFIAGVQWLLDSIFFSVALSLKTKLR